MKTLFLSLVMMYFFFYDYKSSFQEGIQHYNKGFYDSAIQSFRFSVAQKKTAKGLYYLSLAYYKSFSDSLSLVYANMALSELPKLPSDPYLENLQHIIERNELKSRFKYARVTLTLSNPSKKTSEIDDMIWKEIMSYYPDGPEGMKRMQQDMKIVRETYLPHEGEEHISFENYRSYNDPVLDSLN